MNLPKYYYVTEKLSKVSTSTIPSDQLSIERLIAGKSDFWLTSHNAEIKIKKFLIIATKSYEFDKHEKEQLKINLLFLLNENFKIYFFLDFLPFQLTPHNLDVALNNSFTYPKMEEEVLRFFFPDEPYDINNFLFINIEECLKLITGDFSSKPKKFRSPKDDVSSFSLTSSYEPVGLTKSTNLDEVTREPIDITCYRPLLINSLKVISDEEILINGALYNKQQTKLIRSVSLNNEVNIEKFVFFFPFADKISLYLMPFQKKEMVINEILKLETLTSFFLKDENLELAAPLINANKKLEELCLVGEYNLKKHFEPHIFPESVYELKNLIIRNIEPAFTVSFLNKILPYTNKINTLEISSHGLLSDLDISSYQLNELECLTIKAKITSVDLSLFLKKSPNLCYLELEEIVQERDGIDFGHFELLNLEYLSIRSTLINNNLLVKFSHCPNLIYLKLISLYINIEEKINLPKLKYLMLNFLDEEISQSEIINLIKNLGCNDILLTIEDGTLTEKNDIIYEEQTSSLVREIIFQNFALQTDIFLLFLSQLSTAKYLTLEQVDISYEKTPEKIKELLPQKKLSLEKVEITEFIYNKELLPAIIKRSPNLNEIAFLGDEELFTEHYHKEGIVLDFDLFETLHPKLKTISITHAVITDRFIKKIERFTPSLHHAKFRNCSILGIDYKHEYKASPVYEFIECTDKLMTEGYDSVSDDDVTRPEANASFGLRSETQQIGQQQYLDADTSFSQDGIVHVTKIFSSKAGEPKVNPSQYRLSLFEVTLNPEPCTINHAFTLRPIIGHNAIPKDAVHTQNIINVFHHQTRSDAIFQYFLGVVSLCGRDDYQLLPSLALGEELICYQTSNNQALDIKYSADISHYYVKTASPVKRDQIEIQFILKVPRSALDENHAIQYMSLAQLPYLSEIAHLHASLKAYSHGSLALPEGLGALQKLTDEPHLTGRDYLVALTQQKKGACRHRAVVAYFYIKTKYPELDPRIVVNECHAYVEVKVTPGWARLDLGGYPAKINVHEPAALKDIHEIIEPEATLAQQRAQQRKNEQQENIELISSVLSQQYTIKRPSLTLELAKEEIINKEYKKCLLEFSSLNELQTALIHLSKTWEGPFFLVDTYSDLNCNIPYIQPLDATKAEVHEGPGGKLYEFLISARRHHRPLLIINFESFSQDEYISSNTLLDEIRLIDSIEIPEQVVMIGLRQGGSAHAYHGSDFISRLDKVLPISMETHSLIHIPTLALTPKPEITGHESSLTEAAAGCLIIDGYDMANWQALLLGQWCLAGQYLHWQQGTLQRELSKLTHAPTQLLFRNFPTQDPAFLLFIKRLQALKYVETSNGTIALSEDSTIALSTGYELQHALHRFPLTYNTPSADYHVLSQTNFNELFSRYHHDNVSGYLTYGPGLLEEHARKILTIWLIEDLTSGQWQKLADEATFHGVALTVHLEPKVAHPYLEATDRLALISASPPTGSIDSSCYHIIVSNEMDFILDELCQIAPYDYHIDVTDLTKTALFDNLTLSATHHARQFIFDSQPSWLLCQLRAGKKVVLSGHFEPSLRHELVKLFLDVEQGTLKFEGQVVIICDQQELFSPCRHLVQEHIPAATKLDALNICLDIYKGAISSEEYSKAYAWLSSLTDTELEKKSWTTLKHSLNFILNTGQAPVANWYGLTHIEPPVVLPIPPKALAQSDDDYLSMLQTEARKFIEQRNQAIACALKRLPLVTLTGATGVGKSTHVQNHLADLGFHVYMSMDQIQAFLTESAPLPKALFIDEANISDGNYALFESMLNPINPGVYYQGQFYPTQPETHVVIFACNPQSYGGERALPPLLERHGNTVYFAPLSEAFLIAEVIEPLLRNILSSAKEVLSISSIMLSYYRAIIDWDSSTVLLTPRELAHLSLIILSAYQSIKEQSPAPHEDRLKNICHYHCYHFIFQSLPSHLQPRFSKNFKLPETIEVMLPAFGDGFKLVEAHQASARTLQQALLLRQFRRNASPINTAVRCRGLHGLVIEGNPGMGKSALIQAMLKAHKLQTYAIATATSTYNDGFITIDAKMALTQKLALLKSAFANGLIVIMEELNSSPLMEETLNAYLCGYDEHGHPAPVPGFFLLASQNPATMGGRKELSNALKRRLLYVNVPDYSEQTLIELLQAKAMDETLAKLVAKGFMKAKSADPSLTFRQLLDFVFKVGEDQQKHHLSFFDTSFVDASVEDKQAFHLNEADVEKLYGLGTFPTKQKIAPLASSASESIMPTICSLDTELEKPLSLGLFSVKEEEVRLQEANMWVTDLPGISQSPFTLFSTFRVPGLTMESKRKRDVDQGTTPSQCTKFIAQHQP